MGVFRECSNPDCRFRYPDPINCTVLHTVCPLCGEAAVIVNEVNIQFENFSDKTHLKNHSKTTIIPVLDNIRSLYNVGSIFRTANGFGIDWILLCGISPTPHHNQFHKTSLGAEKFIKWEHHNNAVILLDHLRNRHFQIISLEKTEQSKPINWVKKEHLSANLAIFLGNENLGVDPEIIKRSDMVVSIPMLSTKKSYNICVAFGIALYHFFTVSRS